MQGVAGQGAFTQSQSRYKETDMIRKEGDKYILYTRDGKKKLGTHDTREDAEKQEKAIETQKHK
jgi:hypothetical protein